MSATVDVVNASGTRGLPPKRQFQAWTEAALKGAGHTVKTSLSVRIVDEREGAELNGHYRDRHYATNVLSFPVPQGLQANGQLGDIALCAPVVRREALEQNKKVADHWAHLVVHGVLHLLGYDHEQLKDARKMEALEVRILAGLGIRNPYTP
jgi:probable rRNA maturation factor